MLILVVITAIAQITLRNAFRRTRLLFSLPNTEITDSTYALAVTQLFSHYEFPTYEFGNKGDGETIQ